MSANLVFWSMIAIARLSDLCAFSRFIARALRVSSSMSFRRPQVRTRTCAEKQMEIWHEVFRTMNENSLNPVVGRVHVAVCDSEVDRTSLVRAVKKLYPKRVLFLSSVPVDVSTMSSKVERARSRGWMGDACFFMLGGAVSSHVRDRLDSILHAIARGFVTAGAMDGKTLFWRPSNLWLILSVDSYPLPWKIRWSTARVSTRALATVHASSLVRLNITRR